MPAGLGRAEKFNGLPSRKRNKIGLFALRLANERHLARRAHRVYRASSCPCPRKSTQDLEAARRVQPAGVHQVQWGRRVGILRLPRWRGHSARGLRGRPIPVEAPAQQASSRRALQGAPPCAHWQPWPRLGRARARESTQAPDTSLPVAGAFCRLQSRLRPWADSELGLGCDGAALTPRPSRNWPWLRRTSKARSSHVRVCAASGSPSAFTMYTLLDAGELRGFKLQGIDMPAESVRNSFSPIATH
jgi:hypothetical protein